MPSAIKEALRLTLRVGMTNITLAASRTNSPSGLDGPPAGKVPAGAAASKLSKSVRSGSPGSVPLARMTEPTKVVASAKVKVIERVVSPPAPASQAPTWPGQPDRSGGRPLDD